MCDFGSADNSAAVMATQKARDEANAALNAQLKATTDASAAADSNSENDRRASEAAMRRLAAGAMFGAGGAALPSSTGTVFTRELFGS
jgi:hypothetical protein